MTISRMLVAAGVVVFFAATAPPGYAQRHGGGGGHASGGGGGHASAAPRASGSYGGARATGSGYGSARYAGPRPAAAPRSYASGSHVYAAQRGGVVVHGGYGRAVVTPYGHAVVAPGRYGYYYRPYYAFRPRVSVGFGVWVGYPVAYPSYYGYAPYSYPYPYPYPSYAYPYSYPYPYGYANPYPAPYPYPYGSTGSGSTVPSNYQAPYQPSGSVEAQRGPVDRNTGGISFEITPSTAEVSIDGVYSGIVGQFTPTSQPLAATPGRHHIEIRAAGYQSLGFDADIVAGQVIPYQGTMVRSPS